MSNSYLETLTKRTSRLSLLYVEDSKEAIKCGIDAYLLKPFEMKQFISVIFKVVKKLDDEQKLIDYKVKLETLVEEKTREVEYRCYLA